MAVPLAIILLLVCGGLAAAIGMAGMSSLASTRERADRAVGLPAADSAIAKYQYALQSDLIQEAEGYVLTRDAMEQLKSTERGDRVVPNSSLASLCSGGQCGALAQTRAPAGGQFTMVEPVGNGQMGYWQVFAVIPPDFGNPSVDPHVVVYFRAWVSDAAGQVSTRPRMVRVEYRPGLFADYQIITDGPISIGSGAEINGPVHSNGFLDGFHKPPAAAPEARIWSADTARCVGQYGMLSTAQGTIVAPGCARKRENTGAYVNFLKVEESFTRIEQQCGRAYAWCSPPGRGPYLVELNGSRVQVRVLADRDVFGAVPKVRSGQGAPLYTVASLPQSYAMLFDDDVYVRGMVGTQNRLTIATRMGTTTSGSGAADIHIIGDTAASDDPRSSLGLVAQGNIVYAIGQGEGAEVTNSCPVDLVRAAMIAESGSVTIPPVYTTPTKQMNAPQCPALHVQGSIASHHTPIMFWTWNETAADAPWSGFQKRSYTWDERLRRNPPPFFPRSEAWQVVRWSDANDDCLRAELGGNIKPECR